MLATEEHLLSAGLSWYTLPCLLASALPAPHRSLCSSLLHPSCLPWSSPHSCCLPASSPIPGGTDAAGLGAPHFIFCLCRGGRKFSPAAPVFVLVLLVRQQWSYTVTLSCPCPGSAAVAQQNRTQRRVTPQWIWPQTL